MVVSEDLEKKVIFNPRTDHGDNVGQSEPWDHLGKEQSRQGQPSGSLSGRVLAVFKQRKGSQGAAAERARWEQHRREGRDQNGLGSGDHPKDLVWFWTCWEPWMGSERRIKVLWCGKKITPIALSKIEKSKIRSIESVRRLLQRLVGEAGGHTGWNEYGRKFWLVGINRKIEAWSSNFRGQRN